MESPRVARAGRKASMPRGQHRNQDPPTGTGQWMQLAGYFSRLRNCSSLGCHGAAPAVGSSRGRQALDYQGRALGPLLSSLEAPRSRLCPDHIPGAAWALLASEVTTRQ